MIVKCGQQLSGGEAGGAGFVIKHLEADREEVVAFSHRHFIFSVEGACAIGIGKAVPLVVKNGLYPIVSCEDAGQGGVAEEGGLEKLGEMDILAAGYLQREQACCQDKKLYG